jgi:hypothetical protein
VVTISNLPKMQLFSLAALALISQTVMAQEAPVAPKMTLLYVMTALLGERFSLGPIPTGQERIVIPIVGGTFEGPKLNGLLIWTPVMTSPQLTLCRHGSQSWCGLASHGRQWRSPP